MGSLEKLLTQVAHPFIDTQHNVGGAPTVVSLLVLVPSTSSSASPLPFPLPQPQPLFFKKLGAIFNKKIGIIKKIVGAVARPVLDVKRKKLGFVRGVIDRKIGLVNKKR